MGIMTPQEDSSNEEADDISEFFNKNHRLFTVVGVFGALAVYLVDIGYTGNGAFKQGVGGALILFLLTSLIGVGNALSNLKIANENLDIFNMLIYSAVVYSLLALCLTILITMAERFPQGSGNLIAGAVGYTTVIVYSTYVLFSTSLTSINDRTIVGTISPYIPQVSFVIFLLLFISAWRSGGISQYIQGPSQSLGFLWGSVLAHGTITATIYVVFLILSSVIQPQFDK